MKYCSLEVCISPGMADAELPIDDHGVDVPEIDWNSHTNPLKSAVEVVRTTEYQLRRIRARCYSFLWTPEVISVAWLADSDHCLHL